MLGSGGVFPARYRECPGQGINIDFRMGIGDLVEVDIPLDPHPEFLIGFDPLLRADHSNILIPQILKTLRFDFFEPFRNFVVHIRYNLSIFSPAKALLRRFLRFHTTPIVQQSMVSLYKSGLLLIIWTDAILKRNYL